MDPARTSLNVYLFTDIVGSTSLKQRVGDAHGAAAIAAHDVAFRECVERFGGAERSNPGDGFFATFPVPSAAVACALAFQSALAGQQVKARVGIHMGEAVHAAGVGGGEKLLGLAVDAAGRVMGLAMPGQILVTRHAFDSARQQLREGPDGEPVAWRSHGAYAVEGLAEPIEIHEAGIAGLSPLRPPPDTPKAHRIGRRRARGASRGAGVRRRWLLAAVALAAGLAAFLALGSGGREPPSDRELAATAIGTCEFQAAEEAYSRLVGSGKATPEEYLARARARVELGMAGASTALDDAEPFLRDDYRLPLLRARHAWEQGRDAETALRHFEDALLRAENDIEPRIVRAGFLLLLDGSLLETTSMRDVEQLIESDLAALEEDAPDDPRTIALRARQLFKQYIQTMSVAGARESGIAAGLELVGRLERAATLDERWAEPLGHASRSLSSIAHIARDLGHADRAAEPERLALASADAALERVDEHPLYACQGARRSWFLEGRARVRMEAGDVAGAVVDMRAAFGGRKDFEALKHLAEILRNGGHLTEAIEMYGRLAGATNDATMRFNLAFCWQMKGVVAEIQGDWPAAREAYESAIELYDGFIPPSDPDPRDLAYRAEVRLALARLPGADRDRLLEKAGEDFGLAMGVVPPGTNREVEYRRALYLAERGRVDEARRDLLASTHEGREVSGAIHGRLVRLTVRSAARRHVEKEDGEAVRLLELARQRLEHLDGMHEVRTASLHALHMEFDLVRALLAPDATLRDTVLASAQNHAEQAQALARTEDPDGSGDWPSWRFESLALRVLMVRHLRGDAIPEAAALTARLLAEFSAGLLRTTREVFALLGDLCAARGDDDGARRARAHAAALEGP